MIRGTHKPRRDLRGVIRPRYQPRHGASVLALTHKFPVYGEDALRAQEVIEFRFDLLRCFQGNCEKFILDGHNSLLCVPTRSMGTRGYSSSPRDPSVFVTSGCFRLRTGIPTAHSPVLALTDPGKRQGGTQWRSHCGRGSCRGERLTGSTSRSGTNCRPVTPGSSPKRAP